MNEADSQNKSWFNNLLTQSAVDKARADIAGRLKGEDKVDYGLIADYFLKGSALGLGTALSLGLFKILGGKHDIDPQSEDDDHIMYLRKKSSISEGGAITAGIGGAVLSYLVGNKIINYIRKKQAQKALDEAQEQAYDSQGYDIVKKANNKDGVMDTITTGGTALATLLMLSSGVATYAYLNAKYPIDKKQFEVNNPTTVKIIKGDNDVTYISDSEDQQLIEKIKKQASHMEVPAFMLCSMYKNASQAADVVATVAQGNLDKFEKTVQDVGFFNAIDLIKGAAELPTDPVNEAVSVIYCTKQASFNEQFKLLTAAEFGYFDTEVLHSASQLEPQLMKSACDLCDAVSGGMYMSVLNDLQLPLHKQAAIVEIPADIDYVECKSNMETLLKKRAESFLMNTNNCDTSTELSNCGTTPASSKDEQELENESEEYSDSMDSDEEDAVSQDPIDQQLEDSSITDTKELADLFN